MNKLILSAFVASSLLSGPGLLIGSTSAFAQDCGPDAPEAWFRPGGYCDAIAAGKSLTGPVDPGCDEPYPHYPVLKLSMADFNKGERVDVAVACQIDYCTELLGAAVLPTIGDRVRVAALIC